MIKTILVAIAFVLGMSALSAQSYERRADIIGNGDPNRGKCTVAVVVDGTADIQIRGNVATARDLQGQPPQIRRFQCTAEMPANPQNFRFEGVDGRGRQNLIQDPRNGGTAVVRISDPESGAEAYTFDLIWGNGGGFRPEGDRNFGPPERERGDRGGFNGGFEGREPEFNGNRGFEQNRGFERRERFTREEAMRSCQDAIRDEAMNRFGNVSVSFRQVIPDNNPGRNDWITGTIVVSRPWYLRNDIYRFSCSVDFETGRLRTAHMGVPHY